MNDVERLIRVSFARDSILVVGKLVAHRAHDFREHHSQIGFEPIFPRGMAVGCKIEQCLANTPEIAGQIIDRVVDEIFFRAFVRPRRAIQLARTICFEAEADFAGNTDRRVDRRVGIDSARSRRAAP